MGAKQSKGGKVTVQNGTDANGEEGLDTFNKTSTLPATFRNKEEDANKSGTLPRDGVSLDRNTSFSKRFRKSVSKLIGVNEKDEKSPHESSPQKETSPEVPNSNGEISPSKSKDENDSTVKSPVDHKLAQKIARAKFFQELYTTPTNVPKPPRSHNVSIDTENGEDHVDKSGTPVVKLIERHQEAIEKHQEEIRNSMSSPDILKDRLESYRKSKLIENAEKSSISIKKDDSIIQEEIVSGTETTSESCSLKMEKKEEQVSSQMSTQIAAESTQITTESTQMQTSESVSESSSVQETSSQKVAVTETKSQFVAESLETNESLTETSQTMVASQATSEKKVEESVNSHIKGASQLASELNSESVTMTTCEQTSQSAVTESMEVVTQQASEMKIECSESSVKQSVEEITSNKMITESIKESHSQVETSMESKIQSEKTSCEEVITQASSESHSILETASHTETSNSTSESVFQSAVTESFGEILTSKSEEDTSEQETKPKPEQVVDAGKESDNSDVEQQEIKGAFQLASALESETQSEIIDASGMEDSSKLESKSEQLVVEDKESDNSDDEQQEIRGASKLASVLKSEPNSDILDSSGGAKDDYSDPESDAE